MLWAAKYMHYLLLAGLVVQSFLQAGKVQLSMSRGILILRIVTQCKIRGGQRDALLTRP